MSKSFIILALSILLLSACGKPINDQRVPAGEPQFAQPMPSSTATALFNAANISAATETPLIVTATGQAPNIQTLPTLSFSNATLPVQIATVSVSCPAPVPHVQISQQVTVLVEDWDKLKLRSQPALSADNIVMELNQYTQLKILDGPVCVTTTETDTAYIFWKVAVIPGGEVGWVAEGDVWHYFIQ